MKNVIVSLSAVALAAGLVGCATDSTPTPTMSTGKIQKQSFGQTPDGKLVDLYVMTNAKGAVCKVMTYGAIVTELQMPDRAGRLNDIVLGFDNLDGYLKGHPYFGAIVGRVGNRIAKGKFTLDGVTYQLATNNGPNHLHGGIKGFDKVVWAAEPLESSGAVGVRLSYLSKDGEEGYPGNLKAEVIYTLTDDNELRIDYTATTDKDTVANITHHGYWNLAGAENGGILNHELMLYADQFTPVDDTLIPTGELKPVAGTVMDFTAPTAIGARLKQVGGNPVGYDHNYVLNGGGKGLGLVARVSEPTSGRVMEIWSTEPGVQFYSGNFLDGTLKGKKGVVYNQYHGFCLETQHFPDSINHPNFPSYVLKAGVPYKSTTIHKFSAK
ncbi:MAG: galactose mutarotase [Verrucomicrobia bacterium]|nr:galactose mutarotase [Verrucomicrobiota bacterium]